MFLACIEWLIESNRHWPMNEIYVGRLGDVIIENDYVFVITFGIDLWSLSLSDVKHFPFVIFDGLSFKLSHRQQHVRRRRQKLEHQNSENGISFPQKLKLPKRKLWGNIDFPELYSTGSSSTVVEVRMSDVPGLSFEWNWVRDFFANPYNSHWHRDFPMITSFIKNLTIPQLTVQHFEFYIY